MQVALNIIPIFSDCINSPLQSAFSVMEKAFTALFQGSCSGIKSGGLLPEELRCNGVFNGV